MNGKGLRNLFLTLVVVAVGYAFIFYLSAAAESARPSLPPGYEDADLTFNAADLKGYALGFDGLLADWYWMRSLQYIGEKVIKSEEGVAIRDLKTLNPRLLYPMLDNATTLDPRFMAAYSYGATLLPEINQSQAVALLEKGIENNPDSWRLYHYLGYIYWQSDDYEKAAHYYEQGSRIKDSPKWMGLMVANVRTEGASRTTAREIYSRMMEEAEDDETRSHAAVRLMGIDSQDERDLLGEALNAYKQKTGRCINNWRELYPAILDKKLPTGNELRIDKEGNFVDPSDTPYILDTEKCEVRLDYKNTRVAFK